ncbi:MAG: hypothetical protein A2350_14005 [Candidatus Raymondbacteria bacterium RifOxyB12_full_50_8]|uniref:Bulb-type lectin domain-containing protein n=1 Tax=Candidatus Raymondbacteria bacterium RIFOXYD12_FULL_49_13 TaxID=1817890 RepID=A0A1F7FHY4_UNCRA|nr:MAG: hypothetical protein A2248_21355 [Candidatus Raymondbacteria bacterium RIFOXYA2_FULL_49_16]OGJ98655.1 MAG: hypothetical protein A2350_14005 [Candidatus Raymondbacteria bacterium RifOxyB12_full_50_8]OGK06335.1 MAG: hypothetical protein A2519_08675 [Candidatus Raymondbacteria bacterium RIFOXYD12_FULL_49_13]OGP40669.1 MAG: hypothetical protein A2324_03425 [Candidatus Raymondbacteria bacterium RIFOXYB2_FULL_49_35]
MKTIPLACILCVLWAANGFSQAPDVLWTKYFSKDSLHNDKTGDQNGIRSHYIIETQDKGFAITGHCCCYHCTGDLFAMKTDSAGRIVWSQRFDDNDKDEVGNCIQQTADGGYIIGGVTEGSLFIIRTDALGNETWRRIYSKSGTYFGSIYSLRVTFDNGFIASGYSFPVGSGSSDAYLLRLDSNGDTLWTKTFGGSAHDWGRCVQQTQDSGFIICGATNACGAGQEDLYFIRTNASGNTLWTKQFGKPEVNSGGYYIAQMQDNGFAVVGHTNDYQDIYLLRTNANGDTLWTKTIGADSTTEWGRSLKLMPDGGFLIGGLIGVNRPSGYLVRTDASGNVAWTKVLDNGKRTLIMGMELTSDNGIVVTTRIHTGSTAEDGFDVIKLK